MAADGGRSPWFIPVLVALITALGGVAVAIISTQGSGSNGDTDPTTNGSTEIAVPKIAGDYYLDPGNPRIIMLKSAGGDSYTISEKLPANWPFNGTVTWTSDGEFVGLADFDSGTEMRVTLEPMPSGELLTEFDYIKDDQGFSIERVDKHRLVPVG